MYMPLPDFILDWVYAIILFAFIIFVIDFVKRFGNVWVNRKLIHLSSVPAVIFYMYIFKTPYPYIFFSIFFTILLYLKHVRNDLSGWFQVEGNYGEVFFTLSYGFISAIFWGIDRVLGGLIMLFMAVGDSITGIVRSRFVDRWQKHWTGSLAMLIASVLMGYILYGLWGVLLGFIATIFEAQPYLDDNLAVPLASGLTALAIILSF